MKKTYIQPQSQEMIYAKSLCEGPVVVSVGTEKKAGSAAWSREEEMMWDEEQGW